MDKTLEVCFLDQKQFWQKTIDYFDGDDQKTLVWTKEYIICIVRELCEFLDELPWKVHKVYSDETIVDKDKVLEELIDIQKYLWNLMSLFNFSVSDIVDMYQKKSTVVETRWEKFVKDNNK